MRTKRKQLPNSSRLIDLVGLRPARSYYKVSEAEKSASRAQGEAERNMYHEVILKPPACRGWANLLAQYGVSHRLNGIFNESKKVKSQIGEAKQVFRRSKESVAKQDSRNTNLMLGMRKKRVGMNRTGRELRFKLDLNLRDFRGTRARNAIHFARIKSPFLLI